MCREKWSIFHMVALVTPFFFVAHLYRRQSWTQSTFLRFSAQNLVHSCKYVIEILQETWERRRKKHIKWNDEKRWNNFFKRMFYAPIWIWYAIEKKRNINKLFFCNFGCSYWTIQLWCGNIWSYSVRSLYIYIGIWIQICGLKLIFIFHFYLFWIYTVTDHAYS